MSKEDNKITIPLKDILDHGYATQTQVGKIIGTTQTYINRKKGDDFGLILEVVGTYENSEKKLRRSKTKILNRVPYQAPNQE